MKVSSRNKKGTFVVKRNGENESKRYIEYAKSFKTFYKNMCVQKGGK